jgi:CubicO group peptidase (beta-lactamase class C family)
MKRSDSWMLTAVGCVIGLAGCGGSDGPISSANAATAADTAQTKVVRIKQNTPTNAERAAAAQATASDNALCTGITPFYWQIGDQNGALASGTGGTGTLPPPGANTKMAIASSSKWLFGAYAAEVRRGAMTPADIKYLTFHSGYTNFNSCSNDSTVSSCLSEPGAVGGTNGDHLPATDGHFFYNGGHMQVMATTIGLGPDNNGLLASAMMGDLGNQIALAYTQPQLAGGAVMSANDYAVFLRNLLNGTYILNTLLGSNAVCTHTNSQECPSAMFSPVNQSRPGGPNDVTNESWHYSLGHWVEDDPVVGDGAFSSPGRFGFYPWVDANKTYYGVLARFDAVHVDDPNPKDASYITSVKCGRLIRRAWETGQAM